MEKEKRSSSPDEVGNPSPSTRTIGRRQFLQGAAGVGGTLFLSGMGSPLFLVSGAQRKRTLGHTQIRLASAAPTEWREPDLWQPDGGVQTLRIKCVEYKIGEDRVRLRSYNGGVTNPQNLTGPTIRIKPGTDLRIDLWNDLPVATTGDCPNAKIRQTGGFPNTTNLHTHGLHVSPNSFQEGGQTYHSDNVLIHIDPKAGGNLAKFWIKVPRDHPAGTFWYHAHDHGSTAVQLANGMAGALIIEGGIDELFKQKGVQERLFVCQQIPYQKDGGGIGRVEWNQVASGPSITLVNGLRKPAIRDLPAGRIERWRFIDAGIKEMVTFQLLKIENGHETPQTLHQIAFDGITFGDRLPTDKVEMGPGYRVDILVQLTLNDNETQAVYVLRKVPLPTGQGLRGTAEEGQDLAEVIVTRRDTPMDMSQFNRSTLWDFRGIKLDLSNEQPQHTERMVFNKDMGQPIFNINGKKFSHDRVDLKLKLGRLDEWLLSSEKDSQGDNKHPFHIHVNHFQITRIGDQVLKDIPIWRDTIIVREGVPVTARTRPTEFTGKSVMHCHILDHEDRGMMFLMEIEP